MRAAALINDAPNGELGIVLQRLDTDEYMPVASRIEAEIAASLWGIDPHADIDYTEVGDLLD